MQLLTVGKSLKKGSNLPSPYKMKEQNLLPRFASVGRPVSLAPLPNPMEVSRDLFRLATPKPAGAVPAPIPTTQSPFAAPSPAPVVEQAQKTRRFWFSFKSTVRSGQRLVQSELLLDEVKVIRNDLNETDLEIVAPKTAPVPEPVAATNNESLNSTATLTLWRRWTSRLVGSMRTLI